MKQLDEILKRLEVLESRLEKLEKTQGGATSKPSGKREVITDIKETIDYCYYKTSENRVLKRKICGSWSIGWDGYITVATQILLACGEQDAVDFSGFTPESLDEAKKNNTEEYQKLMKQLIALATKYGAKGSLPALLPDDTLLTNYGTFITTEVSKKNIKF